MTETHWSRRELLAGVATLGIGAGLSRRDRALPRSSVKPDHVTIAYDEDRLLKYRPRLRFSGDEYGKFINLYGWIATSSEHETDCLVYWAEYTHQEGVSDYDSHKGDHEPIYVFVKDGAVDSVVYSAYHWLRATAYAPTMDGTHPLFRVIDPWHQYTSTTEVGRLTTLGDLSQTFQSWLDSGLDEALAPGTVVNPWLMTSREHWWRRGFAGISWNAQYVELLNVLGAHGAEESDI